MDFWLLAAVLALEILSIPLIDSATHAADGHYYARKQVILFTLSLLALAAGTFVDYNDLVEMSLWLWGFTLALLGIVLVIGKTVMGSTRWISLGFFDVQPSELAKLCTILLSTKVLVERDDPPIKFVEILRYYAWTGVPCVLILKQPDLGTALVLVAISTGILYVAGTPGKTLVQLGAGVLAVFIVLLLLNRYAGLPLPLQEYQIQRLVSLFNAHEDPLGTGYQVLQSKIAIGSGTIWGKGLGKGTQNRLDFIPEQQTDFIFSVVGEELGFFKTLAVLGLYCLIVLRCLNTSVTAADREGALIAAGVMSMLLFHILVNVGMTMGIMPVTGVPLPFLSYGGTALVMNSFSVGLVLNVSWNKHKILF